MERLLTATCLALACGLQPATVDWLVAKTEEQAGVKETDDRLTLSNGLLAREFVKSPSFGTVSLVLNSTADFAGPKEIIRAVKPEAYVQLDEVTYAIGGLGQEQTVLAYLEREMLNLTSDAKAFQYTNHSLASPETPYPWTPGTRHSDATASWPPKGVRLDVDFVPPSSAPSKHSGVRVRLSYELYDSIPLLKKWAYITCEACKEPVQVKHIDVEVLGVNAPFGAHLGHGSFAPGQDWGGAPDESTVAATTLLHAKTDQAHGAACSWMDDFLSSSSPGGYKDEGAVESTLNCTYTNNGPGAFVGREEAFESFRALILAHDSFDLERQSLGRARVTELLAPATTENPIFFHATDVSEKGFKTAIDQMAEVGFEMIIFSFGTGFTLETAEPSYLQKIKGQVDYARSKGIEVGGYDLICLDRGHGGYGGNVGDEWVTTNIDGSLKEDACFASGWVDKLKGLVLNFISETGLASLETDGPYGGGTCSSENHSHHHGLDDSVYRQTQQQAEFYKYLRSLNVYINQPDNFFFAGGSKTGMGYSENQYSLPRWEDLMISRQGMYDDLYIHTPTQGWMFLPIVQYHGGGSAAAFSPLEDNLAEYEWALAQYLGAGVAACYRGEQLYEGPKSKAVLLKWMGFYQAHRAVLTKPVVHLRRPDMQGWDGWLHVHPFADREVALAMIFNPTPRSLETSITLPLYYSGLTGSAMISQGFDGKAIEYKLRGNSVADIQLSMAPRSITFFVVSRPGVKAVVV